MTREQTYIIVGASLAGAKAAETLRTEGFDGRLVLIGVEHERPTNGRRCRRTTFAARPGARRSTSTTKASTLSRASICASGAAPCI